jgi:hypothetical protein
MKTYEKIEEVIEHLLYSEMGGEVDYSDPWYPTFKSLHELKEKTFEEVRCERQVLASTTNHTRGKTMKEVKELIDQLQARLQNAGGGEILITHKTFTIKLGE